MTYAELKAQIRDLGFAEDDEIEEFEGVVPHAINLAIAEINQIVGSVVGTHEVELNGENVTVVDMEDAEGYLELTETPAFINEITKCYKKYFESGKKYYESLQEDGQTIYIEMFEGEDYNVGDAIPANTYWESDTFKVFNNFDTREDGRMLFINSSNVRGKLKIYYKKQAQQYTVDTDDDAVIDLGRKYHPLIPLLAAYYVWLEDDQSKATMYYNRYETMIQSMISSKPPRVRIVAGGM